MHPDPTKISNNPYPVNPFGFLLGSFFGASCQTQTSFASRVSVSCQKAPVTDDSGWSLCTGNPIWRTFLTSLPILLDVQRGLDTLQMPRRVDLPARDAASLDPCSRLVEVLRGWYLESRNLGNVLVAAELSGWDCESSEAYRESRR